MADTGVTSVPEIFSRRQAGPFQSLAPAEICQSVRNWNFQYVSDGIGHSVTQWQVFIPGSVHSELNSELPGLHREHHRFYIAA